MEFDLATWILVGAAVVISGVSKGGFGASVGFLATPLMALAISPVAAAAIMLPILILMDQVGMISYWRRWRWAIVLPVCGAALIGIGLGSLVFGQVNPDALRLALGVISILFTVFLIARAQGWAPEGAGPRPLRAGIWGAAAGFTSTISHAGGPPVSMYLLKERLPKTEHQASTVLIFWTINLVKLGPYFALGAIDLTTLETSAKLAPAAVLGVLLGVWLHKRVSQQSFTLIITGALLITGAKLCWDGATALL